MHSRYSCERPWWSSADKYVCKTASVSLGKNFRGKDLTSEVVSTYARLDVLMGPNVGSKDDAGAASSLFAGALLENQLDIQALELEKTASEAIIVGSKLCTFAINGAGIHGR